MITNNAAQAVIYLHARHNPLGLSKEIFVAYNGLENADALDGPVKWQPGTRTLDYIENVLLATVDSLDMGAQHLDTEDMVAVLLGDGKTWVLGETLCDGP